MTGRLTVRERRSAVLSASSSRSSPSTWAWAPRVPSRVSWPGAHSCSPSSRWRPPPPATPPAWRRVGLDANWSVGYLAARLYVGWEFLYAGLDKATNSWYSGAGAGAVKGTLTGAIAQSHATAANVAPAVANWFAWSPST